MFNQYKELKEGILVIGLILLFTFNIIILPFVIDASDSEYLLNTRNTGDNTYQIWLEQDERYKLRLVALGGWGPETIHVSIINNRTNEESLSFIYRFCDDPESIGGDYLEGQYPGEYFSINESDIYDLKVVVIDKVHYDEKFGIQLVHYTNPNFSDWWFTALFFWYIVSLIVSNSLYDRLSKKYKKTKYISRAVAYQSGLFMILEFIYVFIFM